jgi:hypothetical protein
MKFFRKSGNKTEQTDIWARPEMTVVFRAEVMPGKTREERTFRIKDVLANGRVELHNFSGEHREREFEPINFLRENP